MLADALKPLQHGVSIVVPVYNAEQSLAGLVAQIHPVLASLQLPFEVILINDGSADGSETVMRALEQENPFVHAIQLMRNYGQHNALLCGIRAAAFDTLVTMDDDLQHPPEAIPVLLARLDEGCDLVYGAPLSEQHGLLRDTASTLTKLTLSTVMNAASARHVSAFRAFRTRLREAFAEYQGPSVSLDVLLTWGTARITYVQVEHRPRAAGQSQYTFRKLLAHALNLVTGFSTIPLRIATAIGFAFLVFGAGILLYVLARYLIQGGVVPGFTFLTCIIVIFSGVQLFTLGIFGEYLARMHFRLMDKPAYMIREGSR